MSFDTFRRILFNAGEQGIAADFNDLQSQLLMMIKDMFYVPMLTQSLQDPAAVYAPRLHPEHARTIQSGNIPPSDVVFAPFPSSVIPVPGGIARSIFSTCAGPIMVLGKSAFSGGDPPDDALDPDEPVLIPYWVSDGEISLTTDVGDATNPRIDIVEVKLEMEDGVPESRASRQEGVRATLDVGALTSGIVDTIVQARYVGIDGNSIYLSAIDDGAGSGNLQIAGSAFVFHFEDGVTTVTDFEAAITAATDLIAVGTPGTGANLFTTASCIFTNQLLTGGLNEVVVTASINKTRHTKATFQLKKGTAAATPTYPTPSAGFVAMFAVYVPATHNAVHDVANIRDLRWPIGGLRAYDVMPHQFVLGTAGPDWALDTDELVAVSSGTGSILRAFCPVGNQMGRLVGVGVCGNLSGGSNSVKVRRMDILSPAATHTDITEIATPIDDDLSGGFGFSIASALDFMDGVPSGRIAGTRIGNPVWGDGTAYGPSKHYNEVGGPPYTTISKLYLHLISDTPSYVSLVRFYIAHGLG